MTASERFRAGVGLVVTDGKGRVLAIERSKNPGAFQLPQGGLDEGEKLEAAAHRELREETGLERKDVKLVHAHPVWLGYELPKRMRSRKTGRGQVHCWFLFRLRADERRIRLPKRGEARSYRWMTFTELLAVAVDFRRGVYRELRAAFEPLIG